MADKKETSQFPSEVIDLPSGGAVYPTDSTLSSGKIEIKYMTAKEEDILTSQNLIKKGLVLEKLLNSLIITPGVNVDDMILGDKNAVMVAARILAYGSEYNAEILSPSGETVNHIFDLSDCPFKELPNDIDYSDNNFELTLPASKIKVKFKLLTGKEEKEIDKEIKSISKTGVEVVPELTTRLKYCITSVDDNSDSSYIRHFIDNQLLSRDSIILRQEIQRLSPDIELTQDVEMEGETVRVDIPMTVNFFWPTART